MSDNVSPHVHSFYEVVFVESGSGSHLINGECVEVGAGDLFLFAPGSSHDPVLLQSAAIWVFIFNLQAIDAEGWGGSIHTVSGHALGAAHSLLRALHANGKQYLLFKVRASGRAKISGLLKTVQEECTKKQVGWEKMVSAGLDSLLVELLRRYRRTLPGKAKHLHPIVAQSMDFIDLNFRRALTLRDIASHVGRSPAYLTNLVNQHTGQPAMVWLADRRLAAARNLILTSRKSVQEISEAVGYDSTRNFSVMFKRRYGESPMNWRSRIAG